VNSEEIREEQVRAASQATVYALLDYFDPRGFAGASVQCHQPSDSNKVSYEDQKKKIIQGEYKLNKHPTRTRKNRQQLLASSQT
jgi:hypothetical protein